MVGDTTQIKKNPTKVACVSRTTYDLLIAFGLEEYIDGAYKNIYTNTWVEAIHPTAANEYRYEYQEAYETFIGRGVDLVFSPEKYITDGLKEHGIPAVTVNLYGTPSFDEYVFFFADLVTQIWDNKEVADKANAWKSSVQNAITDIKTTLETHNIPQKKIYYVRGDKNKGIGYTDTIGSFTEYAFRQLGFDFISTDFETNQPSAEAICAKNPDVFVIGGIYQNTLVSLLKTSEPYINLDAVKNNQVFTIPIGFTMFEQISVMTPIFFYDMANKLYPEFFDYDIHKMIKDTTKEFFDVELSDAQIDFMRSGKDSFGNSLTK